ncbi:type II toxin-antitoxin system RelE/ParE family toxin [Alteromonas mediterranea]|uniref:type II toxin-antitoxin system RelE/ParE family toxin n=1 Tax=Alteromonas mediterranea TaxID=314275 RepID=UPI0009BD7B4F|nr:type II toxin-antitoxin system RelE/ParE family toxin [Alteromonas mediterranea]QDG34420.1 type II toxin-antitoxin system RelE/ParE family toxin [Alteromonas mediterranea]
MRITISNLAKEDLIDIWLYGYKVWGEPSADQYLDDLYGAISLLSSNPYRYPEYQDKNVAPFRLMPIKNHLVAYEVSGSNIFIVRVLHESMDTISRLSVSPQPSK